MRIATATVALPAAPEAKRYQRNIEKMDKIKSPDLIRATQSGTRDTEVIAVRDGFWLEVIHRVRQPFGSLTVLQIIFPLSSSCPLIFKFR
jgi:hypothetical protein